MKLKQLLFTFCVLFFCTFSKAQNPDHTNAFITTWDTGKMNAGITLTIPSEGTNYEYYWEKIGDEDGVNSGDYQTVASGYLALPAIAANSGIYKVYIKGDYRRIFMVESHVSAIALISVKSWGNIKWRSMAFAFQSCNNLNELPVTAPDLSLVTQMNSMFAGANSINQDISDWDVKNIGNMVGMFNLATSFDQNLGKWDLNSSVDLRNMFDKSGLSSNNFGLTLKGWAENTNTPSNRILGASGLTYSADAKPYRDMLTNDKGWTITDGGVATPVLDHTNAFITTWDTGKMDAGTTLTIPSEGANYEYYWEKVGEEQTVNSGSYQLNSSDLSLVDIVAETGIYKIYIKGPYTRITMGQSGSAANALMEVNSWGDIVWTNMNGAFSNCINLNSLPLAAPDLGNVSDMSFMFYGASTLNEDLSEWDVSNITNMSNMFYGASVFNGDLTEWNVSNVTDMSNMFVGASAFDGDLSNWNVSSVTDMSFMFNQAKVFNQDISSWNVENVDNMAGMFSETAAFNQDISDWDVENVSSLAVMFNEAASFNQNLGKWVLNSSVDLRNMLSDSGLSSEHYGLTLKGWAENTNIPSYRILGAAGLTYSADAEQYRDLLVNDKGWAIIDGGIATPVIDHVNAFITTWDTGKMNAGTTLVIPSEGTNYEYYWEKVGEEQTVNSGSYQINSSQLPLASIAAETGVYKVYIKGLYTRIHMGQSAIAAKALTEVNSWGDVTWTNMNGAFSNCINLNSLPLAAPDLGNVSDMSFMFMGASAFDGDLSNWDVSNVTNMSNMFYGASVFNGDLTEWNVSNVTDMSHMFREASAFDGNLSNWNVSSVTDMSYMFYKAKAFNQDISDWNVENVTLMMGTFSEAAAFNQNISDWDVENVSSMVGLFNRATSFDQNLGKWVLNSSVNSRNMLNNSGLSSEHYGLTLKGWAENTNTPSNKILGAAGLTYSADAKQYRDILVNDKGWTITDEGVLPVSLISFTGKVHVNGVQLNWITASESNNSHFIIEKSADGVNFQELTKEAAKGAGVYEVYDRFPKSGYNYYRLTQFDTDGIATVLEVQAINFVLQDQLVVNVYPNPVTSNTTTFVSFPAGVYQKISISDLAGRTISTTFIVDKQQENISLETAGLQPGMYMINLSGIVQTTKKFVKQ